MPTLLHFWERHIFIILIWLFLNSLLKLFLIYTTHDHPLFQEAKEWVTFNVVDDPERNSFQIQHDANTTFKPEELVGMISFLTYIFHLIFIFSDLI